MKTASIVIHPSNGKLRDANVLDALVPEAGVFYVMETRARSFAKKSRKARVVAGKCLREAYRA